MKSIATELNNKYGWNIIPMISFSRDLNGVKQHKFIDWMKYKAEPFPMSQWLDTYKAIGIITGKISDLSILDIDSQEALDSLLNTLGVELEDLAEYIIKTQKGYQLFYKYLPNSRTRIGLKSQVDFLSGGLTFATPTNDGYTLVKDGKPKDMPQILQDYILDSSVETVETVSLERAIRENSDLPYRDPLHYLIQDFVDSGNLGKKIRERLEKVFCTTNYANTSLKDFSKPGILHDSIMYVGGIVSSNPTVDKDLLIQFMTKWTESVAKIDLNDHKEEKALTNRIEGVLKYYTFNSEWLKRSGSLNSIENIALDQERIFWRDLDAEKYIIYTPKTGRLLQLSKPMFKDEVVHHHNQHNETKMKVDQVNVTDLPPIYETFDPTVDEEFFCNEYGEKMFNRFQRSPMLLHFQTCEPSTNPPELIGNILNHLYPIESDRMMFLHSLAYHMTYLQVAPTCYVLTGKSGTGKNILMQEILQGIYGDMHTTISADTLTGRFRNLLKNKLLVFIDEVSEKNHKPTERGSIHNVVKQIVANPTISIEAKGKDEENYPNHALYVMASNKEQPFKLEEGFDRRVSITRSNDDNLRNLPWFPKELSSPEISEALISEVPALVEYLKSIELDPKKYAQTIENAQRKEMISSSVNEVDKYVDAITSKDVETLYELNHDFAEWYETLIIRDKKASVPVRDFKMHIGDIYNKVSKALKIAGVESKKVNQVRSLMLNPKGSGGVTDFQAI